MNEVELKFLLDSRQERLLRNGPAVGRFSIGRARTQNLHSVYHDAPGDALKKAGIALRLRRDGPRWVQTAKKATGSIAQGLSTPIEDEVGLPGPHLDVSRIGNDDLRAEVERLAAPGLAPVVETEFRRTTRLLRGPGGGTVELAIDRGEVRADGNAAPLVEAEFELKDGPPEDVFALARALLTEGPIRFSNRSKSERAGILRTGGAAVEDPRAVRSDPPAIPRDATVEEAAVALLNEIQHQLAANIVAAVETATDEATHQLRIALRRLRVALSAFRPALGCPELEALRDRARGLGATVGSLRDLDVLAGETIPAAAAAAPGEPGFESLAAAVAVRREAVGRQVRAALAGAEVAGFVLDLAGFVAIRRWRAAGADADRLHAPVGKLASKALDRRWRSLKTSARGVEDLSVEGRHDLRKQIKKVRYSADLLGALYPRKPARAFTKSLKMLQETLGALNDAATAEALLAGRGAPAADNPLAQRAAGRMLGAASCRAADLWPRAVADWRALRDTGPFWR